MKFKPQQIITLISVALMLYFTGLYGVLSLQSDFFLNLIKEKIDLMVALENDVSEAEIQAVKKVLDSMVQVKEGSVRYISKEIAKAEMEKEFGEDFLLEGMENPFHDVILFRVNSEYYVNDSMEVIEKDLEGMTSVKYLRFQENIFGPVKRNMDRISTFILILGIILICAALVLIHNTLKLSLNSKKRIIKTMELVGARTGFILRPFILRGFWYGFLSGLLASIAILGTLYLIGEWIPIFQPLYRTQRTLYIMLGLVLSGILLYVIVTYYTVKRYLRIRMEDIF